MPLPVTAVPSSLGPRSSGSALVVARGSLLRGLWGGRKAQDSARRVIDPWPHEGTRAQPDELHGKILAGATVVEDYYWRS